MHLFDETGGFRQHVLSFHNTYVPIICHFSQNRGGPVMTRRYTGVGYLAGLLLVLSGPPILAQSSSLKVGDPAPPIRVAAWLNVPEGETTGGGPALRDKVVLLDFWGTWCGPCVRAMPKVQLLHDRFKDRGLIVVALSYEDTATLKPFLDKHSYTMPVASDTEKKCVSAYGIRSWPTTFLIDKDGTIAYVGGPYSIESEIEKALGLESDPATLLTNYLEALSENKKAHIKTCLLRLTEKSPANFNLREWALSAGGVPKPRSTKKVKGEKALQDCIKAFQRGDAKKKNSILGALATGGPESFDLGQWSRAAYGKAFPITAKEVLTLLRTEHYAKVMTALLYRNPNQNTLRIVSRDEGMRDYCKNLGPQSRTLARKALMVEYWIFKGRKPSNNEAFWRDLSVSGISTSEDKKTIVGVLIAGDLLTREKAPGFIRMHLQQSVMLESLAQGNVSSLKKVEEQTKKLRRDILAELKRKYGK